MGNLPNLKEHLYKEAIPYAVEQHLVGAEYNAPFMGAVMRRAMLNYSLGLTLNNTTIYRFTMKKWKGFLKNNLIGSYGVHFEKSVHEIFDQVSLDMKNFGVSSTIQSTDNVAVCYWDIPFLSKDGLEQGFTTISGRQLKNDKKESAIYKASYNMLYDNKKQLVYIFPWLPDDKLGFDKEQLSKAFAYYVEKFQETVAKEVRPISTTEFN